MKTMIMIKNVEYSLIRELCKQKEKSMKMNEVINYVDKYTGAWRMEDILQPKAFTFDDFNEVQSKMFVTDFTYYVEHQSGYFIPNTFVNRSHHNRRYDSIKGGVKVMTLYTEISNSSLCDIVIYGKLD